MKLYVKIISINEWKYAWSGISKTHTRSDGWYEIQCMPQESECLKYDEENDRIVIKQRGESSEEIKAERQTEIKRQLGDELPGLILQNKDNPEALAAALCNRAKQIEMEIKI